MSTLFNAPEYHLTQREQDVCRLLVAGLPNKSIGRLLHIETQTVKGHMTSILSKTRSDNRVMAALRLVGFSLN